MKILFVTPFYYPATFYGGPVSSIYNLANSLTELGHQVTVYTTDVFSDEKRYDGPVNREVKVGKVKVYYFKNISNLLAYKYNTFLPLSYIPKFISDAHKFDVVHLHDFYTIQNIVASVICSIKKIPYILQARGSVLPSKSRGRVSIKKIFIFLFGRQIVKNAKYVVGLSNSESLQYKRYGVGESKIVTIPNGVEIIKSFVSKKEIRLFKNRWNIPNGNKVIGYLGRINKAKGTDLLVDIFFKIKKKIGMPISLIIVGPDGGIKDLVLQKIKKYGLENDVVLTGLLEDRDKKIAYKSMDIFVLPSRDEPFGNVVFEAISNNVPVAVSNGVGVGNDIDNVVGLQENSKMNMVDCIVKLLDNRHLYKKFRSQMKYFLKDYTWKEVTNKFVKIYNASKNE